MDWIPFVHTKCTCDAHLQDWGDAMDTRWGVVGNALWHI